MRNLYGFLVTTILTCAFVAPGNCVNAQTKSFAREGVTELSGSVSFQSFTEVDNDQSGDATTFFSFAPQVGYFVSDGFELGLQTGIALIPGLSIVTPPRGDATTVFQFFLAPSYNVVTPDGKVYPFVEAQIGYTSASSGNSSLTGFSYGARGGLKIPVVEHLLVSTSLQYLAITLNPERATKRNGFNYFAFGVGVSGYF